MVGTQWPLPPTIEQCEVIVRTHAQFKVYWWDDPRLGTTVGTWSDADGIQQRLRDLANAYERFADFPNERLSPARRSFYARLFDQAPRLLERYT